MAQNHLKKIANISLCSFLLSACTYQLMNRPIYENIQIGMPVIEVEKIAGSPYEIKNTEQGVQYYHYIERIEIGPGTITQNNYILTISNGQVVDKSLNSNTPGSIQFKN